MTEVDPNKLKNRITVREQVYLETHGGKPEEILSSFSRELESYEQPYTRNLTATEEWQSLDFGWLKDNVGMLVIVNNEGKFTQVNPTDEERTEAAKKVLEVSHFRGVSSTGGQRLNVWLIPVGENMRGSSTGSHLLHIRSQHGNTKYTLYAFPK